MKRLAAAAFLASLTALAAAQTGAYETGKVGLVVKETYCSLYTNIKGTLVNRTADPITGRLEVSILDKDSDFLWRGVIKVNVGAQNGSALSVTIGASTCDSPNRIAFRFLD